MKKRLEAELISIAHRILKLKNKSEVDQLYKETQKLYETLTVLKFYGDHFETVKEDIPADVMDEKLTHSFEAEESVTVDLEVPVVAEVEEQIVAEAAPEEEETIVAEAEDAVEEDTIEETEVASVEEEEEQAEEIEEEPVKEPDFKPAFEFTIEHEEEEEEAEPEIKEEPKQIALEDFLGENYVDPVFVKPNEVSSPSHSLFSVQESAFENSTPKVVALNDSMSKTISIGLNDRMGFVKFLFADSNEDYNRVLSQLSTFDTFEEAKNFINDMVKPDYDNWEGKDDYAERFMEIVEQKFL